MSSVIPEDVEVVDVKAAIADIRLFLLDIKKSQEFLSLKYDDTHNEIKRLTSENWTLKSKLADMEKREDHNNKRLSYLEHLVLSPQPEFSNSTVIIHGMDSNEDNKIKVEKLLSYMDCNVPADGIIEFRNDPQKQMVILKVKSVDIKDKTLVAKKSKGVIENSHLWFTSNKFKFINIRQWLPNHKASLYAECRTF